MYVLNLLTIFVYVNIFSRSNRSRSLVANKNSIKLYMLYKNNHNTAIRLDSFDAMYANFRAYYTTFITRGPKV